MSPKYKGGERLTIQDFYLGRVMASRRFPPPWSVQELDAYFFVTDSGGQKLAYVYFEDEPGRRSAAKLLSKDEARRIATNVAKLTLMAATATSN
jgi:hypothetical protein